MKKFYLVVYKHKEMSVGMTVQFRYKFRETFTGLLHNPLLINAYITLKNSTSP